MESGALRIEAVADELKNVLKCLERSLSEPQRKKAELADKIIKSLRKNIKDLKLTAKEVNEIFESSFEWFKEFQQEIQNNYKKGMTDCEAFLARKKDRKDHIIAEISFGVNRKQTIDNFEHALDDFNFDIYNYESQELANLGGYIFGKLKLTQEEGFEKESLMRLVHAFSQEYNIVPYHNFTHVFGVFLMFYQCHQKSPLSRYVDDFELFFALLACLGHDMKHEGLNNLYESKSKSRRAIDFSYTASLERMHLHRTMMFLKKSPDSPLMKLDAKKQERARNIIIKSILSTDMARHFNYVDDMKRRVNATTLEAKGESTRLSKYLCLDPARPDHHEFMIEIFVHAADIGNPCLEFSNYIYWANLVCQEFDDQFLTESRSSLETTAFLQYTSLANFYRNQMSFTNSVVLPLWAEIGSLFPSLEVLKEEIVRNNKKVEEFAKRKSLEAKQFPFKIASGSKIKG